MKQGPDSEPERSENNDQAGSSSAKESVDRAARLKAIREAIQNGTYDTDALLEKAMRRMMERLQDD
jgi:anti-sigma28 factor (negative regulator of flagellin synthesis)